MEATILEEVVDTPTVLDTTTATIVDLKTIIITSIVTITSTQITEETMEASMEDQSGNFKRQQPLWRKTGFLKKFLTEKVFSYDHFIPKHTLFSIC